MPSQPKSKTTYQVRALLSLRKLRLREARSKVPQLELGWAGIYMQVNLMPILVLSSSHHTTYSQVTLMLLRNILTHQ